MSRCIVAAVVSIALVSPAFAQEQRPIDLADLKLDLDRLKVQGEQRYTYRAKSPGGIEDAGKGMISYATEVKDEVVILRDTMDVTYRGKKLSLKLVHHCRKNNFLTPLRIESEGVRDDDDGTFVATIEDGKATVTINGRERVIEIPSDTVSFSALVRLLPLLPRDKGTRISFPYWLESSELNLKKDFVIECLGEEEIARGDQKLLCTKYRLTSMQIMPMDAWIDNDNILQRLLIDGRKEIDLVPTSRAAGKTTTMKIKLTSVFVTDQAKALAFYTDVLGFVKKQDIPIGQARFLTVVSPQEPDDTELLLEPNGNPAAKAFQAAIFKQGIAATAFQVDDIQNEYDRLSKLGVVFTMKPTEAGPIIMAVFNYTCGNLIQLYELK